MQSSDTLHSRCHSYRLYRLITFITVDNLLISYLDRRVRQREHVGAFMATFCSSTRFMQNQDLQSQFRKFHPDNKHRYALAINASLCKLLHLSSSPNHATNSHFYGAMQHTFTSRSRRERERGGRGERGGARERGGREEREREGKGERGERGEREF